jgi:hypothetical protein
MHGDKWSSGGVPIDVVEWALLDIGGGHED